MRTGSRCRRYATVDRESFALLRFAEIKETDGRNRRGLRIDDRSSVGTAAVVDHDDFRVPTDGERALAERLEASSKAPEAIPRCQMTEIVVSAISGAPPSLSTSNTKPDSSDDLLDAEKRV